MLKFEPRDADLHINGKKVIGAWESFSGWYWFATEISHQEDSVIEGKVYKRDTI